MPIFIPIVLALLLAMTLAHALTSPSAEDAYNEGFQDGYETHRVLVESDAQLEALKAQPDDSNRQLDLMGALRHPTPLAELADVTYYGTDAGGSNVIPFPRP